MRPASTSLSVLLALAALSGCTPAADRPGAAVPAPAQERILISVGPCFGFCPVYDVSIASDGAVTFDGKRHTSVVGTRTRMAGKTAFDTLSRDLGSFRPAAGATAQIPCTSSITDTSTYRISWTGTDGRTGVATHNKGCSGGPGQALDKLLETIPGRLGIEDWAKQTTRPGAERG